ncbi:hypothetical protein M081_2087 [Bacteroides fragilis str. 3998 T(B) 4]|nr:hypothetical protein M081_2087 [Bacteroides fragilis str. 3998 T(B) 4]
MEYMVLTIISIKKMLFHRGSNLKQQLSIAGSIWMNTLYTISVKKSM